MDLARSAFAQECGAGAGASKCGTRRSKPGRAATRFSQWRGASCRLCIAVGHPVDHSWTCSGEQWFSHSQAVKAQSNFFADSCAEQRCVSS
eukprot:9505658-Alexandrium_andersonii.AAC.1